MTCLEAALALVKGLFLASIENGFQFFLKDFERLIAAFVEAFGGCLQVSMKGCFEVVWGLFLALLGSLLNVFLVLVEGLCRARFRICLKGCLGIVYCC